MRSEPVPEPASDGPAILPRCQMHHEKKRKHPPALRLVNAAKPAEAKTVGSIEITQPLWIQSPHVTNVQFTQILFTEGRRYCWTFLKEVSDRM